MRLVFRLGILAISLTGCAGPMTPFGAIHDVGRFGRFAFEKETETLSRGPRISFSPERQVLHDATPLSITIDDPLGIPSDYRLRILFNNVDVSTQYLRRARIEQSDDGRRISFTADGVRMRAAIENKLKVVYGRNATEKPLVTSFNPPRCSAFASNKTIEKVPRFNVSPYIITIINKRAREKNLNPYYLTGLIAQESSFDPNAVSPARAIGLTQMTGLAEAEIIAQFGHFPRYPQLSSMNLLSIKLAIMQGSIHANNEWRLNPEFSIAGGVEYLRYILDYWSRPDKRAFVMDRVLHNEYAFSDVVLASYNSGAARVSQALERLGGKWLQDQQLGEARKYVRRVNSFCDYYEQLGGSQ